jgi:hypothetical protein
MAPEQRSLVCTLLAVCAVAIACARIGNAELAFEPSMYRAPGDQSPDAPPRDWPATRPAPMPTFSSNDRSRWCTVRALVDHGTWVIGQRRLVAGGRFVDSGIVFENGWQTVDKALDPETQQFYSTKPPLLTALAAGEYWLLKHALGWSITAQTNLVVKTTLLTFNILPLAFYLLLLHRLVERLGTTDWGRLFTFTAACFGTYVTTFAITLNNHTPAAVTALAALYAVLPQQNDAPLPGWRCLCAGLFAGLTACLELPAAGFLLLVLLAIVVRSPARGLLLALPAAMAPVLAELALNYLAIHEWLPIQTKFGGPWYQYAGSHWLPPPPGEVKHGIDWARLHESIWAYGFHVLVGHHGVFSLTPIWVLSFAGMAAALRRRTAAPALLAPLTLLLSLAVMGFYLMSTSNYGGWTSGLRWLIWLTPLWLLAMLPAADYLAERTWGRRTGYALLAISVFSASFAAANPWRHPWIYQLLEAHGWIRY